MYRLRIGTSSGSSPSTPRTAGKRSSVRMPRTVGFKVANLNGDDPLWWNTRPPRLWGHRRRQRGASEGSHEQEEVAQVDAAVPVQVEPPLRAPEGVGEQEEVGQVHPARLG